MSRSTLRLDIMIALVAVALVAVFAIAGCAPQQADSGSSEGTKTQTVSSEAGAYVSDEQCLMAVATKRLPSALLTWVIGIRMIPCTAATMHA